MKLIVITPEISHPDEMALVHSFFENGLYRLHIRKPFFTPAEYRTYLLQIDKKFHSLVSVHGGFLMVNEFPGLGIHLPEAARDDENISAMMNAVSPLIRSASFHTWNEITANEDQFAYVFISPVFDSISKKGYKAAIDLSMLSRIKQELLSRNGKVYPIFGLGGVDCANIKMLHQYGFDGAAVLGAVWESAEPLNRFTDIQNTLNRLEPVDPIL